MNFLANADDALGINRVFPLLAEDDSSAHDPYFGSAKWIGKPIMDEILALIRNTQGAFPQNDIINPGMDFFRRGGVSGAVALGDGTYTGPDRFYGLTQAANATEQQIAAPTGFAARNVCELTSGGTTNRFGKATALEAAQVIPMRGQQKTFAITARASKNAGSGTINIRMAILEWFGTADAPTKDVVNNWASTTYTAGNFFISSNYNILAVSPQIALTHNTAQRVTLTANVGVTANNLILVVWAQDVPAHANDKIQISQFGLFHGNYAPTLWQPRPAPLEALLCNWFCRIIGVGSVNQRLGVGQCYSTTRAEGSFLYPEMRKTPNSATIGSATAFSVYTSVGGLAAASGAGLALSTLTRDSVSWDITTAGSLTAGNAAVLVSNGANGYVIIDAEI